MSGLAAVARPLAPWLGGLIMLVWVLSAEARELAADVGDMVEVEVATVAVALPAGLPVVLLREPGAQAVVPIFIGPHEAGAILRGLRGDRPARPMTHELFGNVLEDVEVQLERVYVDAIVDNSFLGMLELRVLWQEEPVRVDSRPSDAIALALSAGASIHVAPRVMEAARQIDYAGLDDSVVTALGITVTSVTDDLREALELPDQPGVLVSDVWGAAEEADLKPGALLLEINEQTPETPMAFLELIRATPRNEQVVIRYWQAGEERELELSTDVPAPRSRVEQGEPAIEI